MKKPVIPIANESDFRLVEQQERGKKYICISGELFFVEENCLFKEDRAEIYFLSLFKNFKAELEAAKNHVEYDTVLLEMKSCFLLPFRVH